MSQPFLKWAGGKRWLVATNQLPLPRTYRRYIEPFLGGGAVFFHLRPARAILADINSELIELYEVLRDQPAALQQRMREHHRRHSRDYYYMMRNSKPRSSKGRAARTLYLNRTCWNGLYRVNLRGEFNVPIGTKDTVLFEGEDFEVCARLLANAELRCADFSATIAEAGRGDFLFVDPPYTVQHNNNGFVKYNEDIFSWADQVRLRDAVNAAVARGAAVVLTNADHDSIQGLYRGVCDYRQLTRPSVLAGLPDRRCITTEALFTANL